MNREQFNSALNGISDGLVEEAAGAYEKKSNQKRTLLQWAAAGLAERHRRKTVIAVAAAGLCLTVVLAAAGAIWGGPAGVTGPTQPTISMENPTTAPATQPETTEPTQQDIIVHTGNVYFLTETDERAELTPVQANLTIPWDHIFHVRSLKDLTEEQIQEVIEEEKQAQMAYMEKYGGLTSDGRYSVCYSRNAVIRYYSAGSAYLILLNDSQIESVDRETTGVLNVGGRHSTLQEDYTVGKGEYTVTIPGGSQRVYLECSMTGETRKIFEENPDTPLSTIRETITVTINYKNGTKEIVVIDVTVDDNGQIYMTQRGVNIGV